MEEPARPTLSLSRKAMPTRQHPVLQNRGYELTEWIQVAALVVLAAAIAFYVVVY